VSGVINAAPSVASVRYSIPGINKQCKRPVPRRSQRRSRAISASVTNARVRLSRSSEDRDSLITPFYAVLADRYNYPYIGDTLHPKGEKERGEEGGGRGGGGEETVAPSE
jgi:hypothetical protein